VFRRIAIVGFGLIGGSLAQAVRVRWPETTIVAIDREPVVDAALLSSAAQIGGPDLTVAVDADLIVLAAPIRQNIARLRELPSVVDGEALITDVGSTKRATIEAACQLPERLRFVGGHPLAGAAASGLAAARSDLFERRPWILTPVTSQQAPDVQKLTAFVAALGARPTTMDAIEHDRLMAYISHLPQLAVSALMAVVGDYAGTDGLALAGSGLRDTTRLAASPSSTWQDVTATNGEAIAEAVDRLIAALQRLKADVGAGTELVRVFDSAGKWKRVLDRSDGSRGN
jgi:prephenate dehydrogenase